MVNGQFLFGAALALYALGTLHYLSTSSGSGRWWSRWATGLVLAGFAAQTIFFFLRMAEGRYFPVSNLFEAMAFFAWSIILLFLIYEQRFQACGHRRLRRPDRAGADDLRGYARTRPSTPCRRPFKAIGWVSTPAFPFWATPLS